MTAPPGLNYDISRDLLPLASLTEALNRDFLGYLSSEFRCPTCGASITHAAPNPDPRSPIPVRVLCANGHVIPFLAMV